MGHMDPDDGCGTTQSKPVVCKDSDWSFWSKSGYYSRVRGRVLVASDINYWGGVELASAVQKYGIVHGSLMDRKLRHLKTRSNAAVLLFKAVRKVGQT